MRMACIRCITDKYLSSDPLWLCRMMPGVAQQRSASLLCARDPGLMQPSPPMWTTSRSAPRSAAHDMTLCSHEAPHAVPDHLIGWPSACLRPDALCGSRARTVWQSNVQPVPKHAVQLSWHGLCRAICSRLPCVTWRSGAACSTSHSTIPRCRHKSTALSPLPRPGCWSASGTAAVKTVFALVKHYHCAMCDWVHAHTVRCMPPVAALARNTPCSSAMLRSTPLQVAGQRLPTGRAGQHSVCALPSCLPASQQHCWQTDSRLGRAAMGCLRSLRSPR